MEASTRGPAIIQHTEAEVRKQLQKQRSQVRGKRLIVLSHAPPYGILDRGIRFASSHEKTHHIGSTALVHFIKRTPVDLVVCGHCHSHGGRALQLGSTTIVNVASHDSPGANGNFALIDLDSEGNIEIKWHDTTEHVNQTSLTCLYGVGRARESILRQAGIKTLTDLAKGDAGHIAEKSGLSDHFVKQLQLRIKSLLDNKIHQTATLFLPVGNPIFFDIETDPECERVWLIGVLKDGEFRRFYADTWKEERKILEDFLVLLRDSPASFLAASSGTNFDQRVIQGALKRQALDTNFFSAYPSIDLCQAFRRSFIVCVCRS